MLLSCIEGQDAEDILPTLDEKTQYELGNEAGKILKRLHEISIITNITWQKVYQNKIPRKIQAAKEAKIKHKHLDIFIDYVLEHTHIVQNNTMKFKRGDYHIGNMVITNDLKFLLFIEMNSFLAPTPFVR